MMTKESSLDKVLLFLYVVLKPFYLFPSGNPQVADWIMLLLIALTFLTQSNRWSQRTWLFFSITFLLLYDILMVNGIWAIILGGVLEVFDSTKWYVYNAAVMLTLALLFQRDPQTYVRWIFLATVSSLFLQSMILATGLAPDSGDFRQSLFFNNPNQLGYYGLLCMGICLVCARFVSISPVFLIAGIGCSLSIIAASLSKAAIISAVLMYAVFLFVSARERAGHFWINLICVLSAVLLLFFTFLYTNENMLNDASFYTQIKERMETLGEDSDDNLASRGYDRIANHPQYIFFGAGEGAYERFDSSISLELHSTIANLFFSYGLAGTFLFLLLLYAAVRGHMLVALYPLGFQLLYGLTHNGIRETFFWIMLSLYCTASTPQLLHTENVQSRFPPPPKKNGGDLT
jgi:hypothetical protein